MLKRVVAMSTVAVAALIGGAPAAHAECVAADVYVVRNGTPHYVVPFHTCLARTPLTMTQVGAVLPGAPPTVPPIGFDAWLPIFV